MIVSGFVSWAGGFEAFARLLVLLGLQLRGCLSRLNILCSEGYRGLNSTIGLGFRV